MDHQSPAARLVLWSDHLATFRGKDARSGGVDVREEDLLQTSGQHAYTATWSCRCRRIRRHLPCEVRRHDGEQSLHRREAFGKKIQQSRPAQQRLQSGTLIEKQWSGKHTQPRGVREGGKEQSAEERIDGGGGGGWVRALAGV